MSSPASKSTNSTPARRSPYKVYDRARRAAELATPPNKTSTTPPMSTTTTPAEASPSPDASGSGKRRSFRIYPKEMVLDFQPGFDPKNLPADVNVLYHFRKTPVRYKPSPEEDSPSRQLMEGLQEDIRKINIAAKDKMDIHYAELHRQKEERDKIDADKKAKYLEHLERVKISQAKVKEHSDFLLAEHRKQQEAELRRKEAEERAEKERLEKIRLAEKAELERKEREETARREAAAEAEKKRIAAEEAKKAARDEAERKKREADLKAKELKDQQDRVEAAARAEEEKKTLALECPEPTEGQKAVHARYLDVHARLKDLRKYMVAEAKTNPALKPVMGDMRRAIKKCVGQLTEGKGANKQPLEQITNTLRDSLKVAGPMVDMREFIAFPPDHVANSANCQGPALMVYLLNIFTKCAISQFMNESGINPRSAEPIGIILAQIFSYTDFHFNGVVMTDILICKYHKLVPVLFGFNGNEKTDAGKVAVGWPREDPKDPKSPFVHERIHTERQSGLAAGYAAFGLRNFAKVRRANPYPVENFYRAFEGIVKNQACHLQTTHWVVLKAMVENHVDRILAFFGESGHDLLKRMFLVLPKELPNALLETQSIRAVYLLAIRLRDEKGLIASGDM